MFLRFKQTVLILFAFLALAGFFTGCISGGEKTDISGALADGSLLGSTTSSESIVTVTLTSQPSAVTNNVNATFAFTLSAATATSTCSLDGGAATACTSPVTEMGLAAGAHTFTVTPTSASGVVGTATTYSWTIDTTLPNAPAAVLSSSTPTNSSAATITLGNCTDTAYVLVNETGVAPAAGAAGWQACSTVASAITHTISTDGNRTLSVWAKDAAENVSATSTDLAVTLDSTAPAVTLTSLTGGQSVKGGANTTITWTATDTGGFGANPITIRVSTDGGTNWSDLATNEANDGTYTWAVPAATNNNQYRIRVVATDARSNVGSATSTSNFIVDSTAPTLTAGQMSLNGGAANTSSNYVQVSLAASDNLSNVTHFCLRYNNTTTPTAADTCWISVTANPPGLTAAQTLTLTNYSFLIGFSGAVYTVYAWVRDAADNISSLTAAGAGTDAQDRDAITYSPGNPPTLTNIIAANTDSPSSPIVAGETTAGVGASVYIKWNASDDAALPASPISLYYTTNDSTYTLIAANLNNGTNGVCTVDGVTYTGCYHWNGGSPSASYYKIRIAATDSNSMVTYGNSNPLNTWPPIKFLAGNTEPGLGSSASAAMFFSNTETSSTADPRSFVVKTDGTIFFRDIRRGILKVDPTTGVQSLYIATTGTSTGDTGAATSATLRLPNYIALDYSERLLILDHDRIRRVETNGTIDTIIGGGADTADTADPLDVQFTPWQYSGGSYYGSFFPLPNGDIYFWSESPGTSGLPRVRYYDASDNLVKSLRPSGLGDSTDVNTNLAECRFVNLGVEFNTTTSAISNMLIDTFHGAGNGSINTCSAGTATGGAILNSSGAANAPHPSNASTTFRVQGRDGKLYGVNRINGLIRSFNFSTRTWTTLVGTGTNGSCSDGTAATSCAIDPQDVFVTANSRIYFVDRGRIRYVDDNNQIVTIAGQSFNYGDGGAALSARFGKINDIELWDDAGTDKIVTLDQQELTVREFSIDGNISLIAGNGANGEPDTVANANVQGIRLAGSGQYFDYFEIDSSGNIYMSRTGTHIGKIDRSTGKWVDLAGGGATAYTAADGSLGSAIDFLYNYNAIVIGSDGTSILAAKSRFNGSHVDALLKTYLMTNGTQSALAGVTGAAGSSYCAVGGGTTALTSCAVPYGINQVHVDAVWDTVNSRWIAGRIGTNSLRILVAGGNMTELAALPRTYTSFSYNPATNTAYYCSSGLLYKYNVGTSTETALTWPISSMSCAGRTLIYSSARSSLIFIYTQNNLYGIAEYENP